MIKNHTVNIRSVHERLFLQLLAALQGFNLDSLPQAQKEDPIRLITNYNIQHLTWFYALALSELAITEPWDRRFQLHSIIMFVVSDFFQLYIIVFSVASCNDPCD